MLPEKKSEAETSLQQYKQLFENLTSGVLVQELIYKDGKAVDARIVDANRAYFRHTGIRREEVIGKRLKKIYPDYREDLFRKMVDVVEKGTTYESDEYMPQFGRYLSMAAHKFDRNTYVVIFDDITDQVKATESINRSEQKFRDLFRNMVIGLTVNKIIRNGKGNAPQAIIQDVNPAFEKIAGISAAELVDHPLTETVDFFNKRTEKDLIRTVANHRNFEMEIQCNRGHTHYRLIAFPIGDDQFVLSVQEISEEKREYLARHHLASIVDSSEDAIYSLSLEGKVLSWNRGAQNFYGYTGEEVIDRDVSLLTPDLDQVDHIELISKVVSGNTLTNLELVHRSKNGKVFPVYLTKSPIYDRYGSVIAVSNIVKNITRIKEREAELIRAREKAEKAGRIKNAFLQNVSHEIRTPMNSVLGFTDILKKRIGNGENSEFIRPIEESGKQLVRIIDDILDISRMEANELNIYKSTFDLHQLLDQVKEQFDGVRTNLGKQHIGLMLMVPESGKKIHLYTDRHRLRQILDNLLSNAVKYTDRGQIDFGYTYQDPNLVFFVKDTGRGIRKSHQKTIFRRFNRIEDESSKAQNGTGLGLSICRGLVRRLGGEIRFESEFEKGSTFYFTIPFEVSDELETYPSEGRNRKVEVPDLEGKTILVAEDDVYSLQMLLIMLSDTRAEILFAKDGREAMEIIRSHQIDLALLDIRLPEISGYELIKAIRQENDNVVLIAQTAYAMSEDTRRILEAGFQEHLKKPISPETLFGVLNKYFARR